MRLKSVDLPEPFGPMMPRTSPSLTERSTFDTAVMPPNRLVRFLTSSSMGLRFFSLGRRFALGRQIGVGPALADRIKAPPHEEMVDHAADALRHEHDRQHDHR